MKARKRNLKLNSETLKAIEDAKNGKIIRCENAKDMIKKLNPKSSIRGNVV